MIYRNSIMSTNALKENQVIFMKYLLNFTKNSQMLQVDYIVNTLYRFFGFNKV